jgi:hypothetical protein
MRTILFDRVVRKLTSRPVPNSPPPMSNNTLDICALLKTAILSFDSSFVADSKRSSSKIIGNETIPQEAAYQAELERILRCWLPNSVKVITQHNFAGRKICSIVILPSRDERIVLEIVVSETANIEEHFFRAREYANILHAKECWALYITTDSEIKCPTPDDSLDIKVLNVYHNLKQSTIAVL